MGGMILWQHAIFASLGVGGGCLGDHGTSARISHFLIEISQLKTIM